MNRVYKTNENERMLVLASPDICEDWEATPDKFSRDMTEAAKELWVLLQTMTNGDKLDFATDIEIDGSKISASSWFGVRKINIGFDCGDVWIFGHYGGGGVWALNQEHYEDDADMADKIARYFADNDICEVAVELSK